MKKLFLFLLINIYIYLSLSSQEVKLATPEQFKKFLTTTTYVVKTDNPFSDFNNVIEESMSKVWTLTKYKIISTKEFENLKTNPANSFIFLSEAVFTQNKETISLDILNITLGTKSGNLNLMPDLGSAPLAYLPVDAESEEIEEQYLYFIPGILRFFQYNIKYQANQSKVVDLDKLANKNLLANKTLYICSDNLAMDVNSIEKIANIYSGEVKIANKEDIYNTLLNGDSKAAVALAIKTNDKIGLNCFKFIIDANTGALIYYAIQEVKSKDQDGFTASDFKKLL
ncbi:MAG: hypothetical protein PHF55_08760 [Bacteroidales bacterium]|jgi:hypothetical protein|nr:hypothetical protein [Bacteroidales bacterium]MDI3479028.1 hypothetical protein [Rikenellaceae bacterium]MDI3544964.1 hypothetical protein [Rikenellaceae bacterium]MDN5355622.1 hypothetical protein [Rikenellaceae bacterium]